MEKLEPRVLAGEKEIECIKEEIVQLQDQGKSMNVVTTPSLESLVELNERCLRAKNVMAHSLSEGKGNINAQKEHDKEKMHHLLLKLNPIVNLSTIWFFRLGRITKNKPRPTKIIFKSKEEALGAVKSFANLKVGSNGVEVGFSLLKGRALTERNHKLKLKEELKDCQAKIKLDITIKI